MNIDMMRSTVYYQLQRIKKDWFFKIFIGIRVLKKKEAYCTFVTNIISTPKDINNHQEVLEIYFELYLNFKCRIV